MEQKLHKIFTYLIAIVWIANGFFCKVLNLIPRHQQIVSEILDETYAREFTFLIGISEVVMAFWILSGIKSKINAFLQILIVATMNILEFMLVPDLLLWGKANSIFAGLFIIFVYVTEFILNKNTIAKN